ncbi:MAG: lysophospholipase, partial [Desulfobacterota bacterium]|nr:lysophospholipase [Thermodesulfobacteriota bacterium]
VFDYRGYGNSDGSPSEQGTYRDGEAAWDYHVTARKIAPEKIVIWGRSLGGAVAARTAVRHQAGVLIVESAFTSVKDLVNDRFSWVPSWVMADYHYDTRESLGKVRVPVLVIHSPDDEIVPFQHGKALYDSIPGPKAFVEIKGSHNRGFIESRAVYESSIDEFISRYLVEGEAAIP